MDKSSYLLNLLERVLGKSTRASNENYAFVCPFHVSNPPGKKKLEINVHTEQWACWACKPEQKSKGKNIFSLFKKLKVSSNFIDELKYLSKETNHKEYIHNKVELPKEFKPLLNISEYNIIGKHAIAYLKKRNITETDIIKYGIGYCEEGEYTNHIIIPSYDNYGVINYFTARNFSKYSKNKYKNPKISRDIIGFELFINWSAPLILCEGVFDAIAIKRNAIPLFGKTIQNELMKRIISSEVKQVFISLDKDAQNEALKYCEELMNAGKEVFFVETDVKDASELGFENYTKLVEKCQPMTFSSIMQKKLNL
jgi:DNA primase